MRSKTDFQAAAHLTYCPRLGTGMLGADKAPLKHEVVALAAAKDASAATEDVRCEPGTRNRITQCEGAQNSAYNAAVVFPRNDNCRPDFCNIFERAPGAPAQPSNSEAKVPWKKYFRSNPPPQAWSASR